MNTTETTTTSFPILGILGVVFVTLKLTGRIAWSWWWVLAPFWMPWAVVIVLAALIIIMFARES